MKKKIVTVGALTAVLLVGGFLVSRDRPTPAEETADTATQTNLAVEKPKEEPPQEKIEVKPIEPQVQTNTNASGTVDEAPPIETSADLAYEQQLAEEGNGPTPDTTITMYAVTDCNIRATGSTDGEVLGGLKRGDSITVSKVGEWNTVVFDDGREGYIRNDLLSDTKPEPLPDPVPEQAQTQAPVEEPPAPQPQPQPSPNKYDDLFEQMLSDGTLMQQDVTASGGANSHVQYVDPNAAENAGIDVDSINVH